MRRLRRFQQTSLRTPSQPPALADQKAARHLMAVERFSDSSSIALQLVRSPCLRLLSVWLLLHLHAPGCHSRAGSCSLTVSLTPGAAPAWTRRITAMPSCWPNACFYIDTCVSHAAHSTSINWHCDAFSVLHVREQLVCVSVREAE